MLETGRSLKDIDSRAADRSLYVNRVILNALGNTSLDSNCLTETGLDMPHQSTVMGGCNVGYPTLPHPPIEPLYYSQHPFNRSVSPPNTRLRCVVTHGIAL